MYSRIHNELKLSNVCNDDDGEDDDGDADDDDGNDDDDHDER